jgi:hypothetical protein
VGGGRRRRGSCSRTGVRVHTPLHSKVRYSVSGVRIVQSSPPESRRVQKIRHYVMTFFEFAYQTSYIAPLGVTVFVF